MSVATVAFPDLPVLHYPNTSVFKPRPRGKSYEVVQTGNRDLKQAIASKALGCVRIRTDDAEFYGHLIRNDEDRIVRVGTDAFVYRNAPKFPFDNQGRQEYQVLKVDRSRIEEMTNMVVKT